MEIFPRITFDYLFLLTLDCCFDDIRLLLLERVQERERLRERERERERERLVNGNGFGSGL